MYKTYMYDCEHCAHHEKLSEVEAYRAGTYTKCNNCGEAVTIYVNYSGETYNA